MEDLLNVAREKGEPPFLVLSDGIEDPHNLGAVMRSALLCGAHGIVIPKRGGASVTPTVIKSSAGAAERLPVARVANIGETIRRLKDQGVFVYCADMDGVWCGWIWPLRAPVWTASMSRWRLASSCTRSRASAPQSKKQRPDRRDQNREGLGCQRMISAKS